MRRWLPLIVALGLAPDPVVGCQAPDPVRLEIRHATFGELGEHAVTFRCEHDRLIAETRAEITVEILFIEAFHRSVHYIEVWSGDQLLEFFGETVDDGERSVVRARLEGGSMVIDGPGGRVQAPPEVIPSHPWHPVSVERTLLFDVVDGVLVEVENRYLGEEHLQIGGEVRLARRYATSGETQRELWYGADGSWLQWRLERQGTVTLTRKAP